MHWLGTACGLEARVIAATPFTFHAITIAGWRNKGLGTYVTAPLRLGLAIMQAGKILYRLHPDLVLGMGGFVSGPGGIASYLLRYPLVIHEQNAIIGFTNRYLAYLAKKILLAFPHCLSSLNYGRHKTAIVGNPVRTALTTLLPPIERATFHDGILRLLILGGSLGAEVFNHIMPMVLMQLKDQYRIEVWHQCGQQHLTPTEQHYAACGIATGSTVRITGFISDMAHAYTWATLVLGRAGALTITELCQVGLGAVLVPYPHAVDDHQTANARILVQHQAAICLPQADLQVEALTHLLLMFCATPQKCLAMAQAAYTLQNTETVKQILSICQEYGA